MTEWIPVYVSSMPPPWFYCGSSRSLGSKFSQRRQPLLWAGLCCHCWYACCTACVSAHRIPEAAFPKFILVVVKSSSSCGDTFRNTARRILVLNSCFFSSPPMEYGTVIPIGENALSGSYFSLLGTPAHGLLTSFWELRHESNVESIYS